jgi:hypothetical protein
VSFPACSRRARHFDFSGRSGDPEEERRIDRQQQVPPHRLKALDQPVVNKQPAAVAEGVAIRLLDGTPDRRANVSHEQWGLDVVC